MIYIIYMNEGNSQIETENGLIQSNQYEKEKNPNFLNKIKAIWGCESFIKSLTHIENSIFFSFLIFVPFLFPSNILGKCEIHVVNE